MTCIDDLFDWLLEEVFTRLTRKDRLICKIVCRRWNNILMDSVYFRNDRHIYLLERKIKVDNDPINVLMQAKKPYEIYTIDDIHSKNVTFFERIGASILELIVKGQDVFNYIFTTMPSLKSLTLEISLDKAFNLISEIKRKQPNFAYHNLEHFQLDTIYRHVNALEMVNVIKKYLPQYCRIVFSNVGVSHKNNLEDFFQIMEMVLFKKIRIDAEGMSDEEMEKFLQVKNFNCDQIFISNASGHREYFFLEALQNKHQNLKTIKMWCDSLPPVNINLTKLSCLSLSLRDPVTSKKSLEKLKNLEALRINSNVDNECGFGHETLNMPKLKTLTMHLHTLCTECLKALSNSFENLVKTELKSYQQFSFNEFKIMIDNWKNLKTLMVYAYCIDSQQDDLNVCFESKNFLRSLRIPRIKNLKKETLEMMSLAFPNLEELRLEEDFDQNLSFFNVIQAIIPTFTKLNSFTYSFSNNYPKPHEFEKVFDHFESNGFPLEDRDNIEAALPKMLYFEIEFSFDREKMISKII